MISLSLLAPAILIPFAARSAQVQRTGTAKAFVKQVYADYSNSDWQHQAERVIKFYSPSLKHMIVADAKRHPGEISNLDFDPICACQDPGDPGDLRVQSIELTTVSPLKARATVSFTITAQPQLVTLSLLRTAHGWRIDEISTKDVPSLRRLLSRPDVDIWWLYGARRPAEHPFAAEAHALLASLPHAREHVYYSAATQEERDRAHAAPGRLSHGVLAALAVPASASAYICGPAAFMTDMRDALTALGAHPARIHTELFGALAASNPGVTAQHRPPPHQPAGPPGTGPQVTFARAGITTRFGDAWRSVLELADACDVPTRWSCRTGVCHTCVTPLLSGEISYAPDPLELPPDGQILICCARPGTDLVLDM